MADEPIVKLQPDGQASIVNYNVPERTSYPVRGLIEIALPLSRQRHFKDKYYHTVQWKPDTSARTHTELTEAVNQALSRNYFPRQLFPNMQLPQSAIRSRKPSRSPISSTSRTSDMDVAHLLLESNPELIAERMLQGEELVIYKNMFGSYQHKFIMATKKARPRLYLVETYRLTSFLGDYGAGRTLKTFSLLPGENTTISIKTYKKSSIQQATSSSVLDSYSEESASSFEDEVQAESGTKTTEEDSFSYYLDGQFEGGVDIGIASAGAELQSGFKGTSNSAREEFGKTLTSATEKHSAKASANREVEINTSFESKSDEGGVCQDSCRVFLRSFLYNFVF